MNREIEASANSALDAMSTGMQKFRVQAGLTQIEGEAAQKKIIKEALKVGATPEVAQSAATQLVSSGFSPQDAQGPALSAMLRGLAASNQLDTDPTAMVQAAGQYLAATGQEKNAANLQTLMVSGQRLFKGTDFQMTDLAAIAPKFQGMTGRLDIPEQLGLFDLLREKSSADVAGTSAKGIVETLTGAGSDKKRTDLLKSIGLTPDSVDLVGENITTALDSLAGGIGSLPEKSRAGFIQQFFGREIASPAEGLLRERGRLGGIIESMKDVKGFDADVEIATSGLAAGKKRQELVKMQMDAQAASGFEPLMAEANLEFRNRGASPLRAMLYENVARTMHGLGFSPETAIGATYAGRVQNFGDPSVLQSAKENLQLRQGGSEKQDKFLESMDGTLKRIEAKQKPGLAPARPVNPEAGR